MKSNWIRVWLLMLCYSFTSQAEVLGHISDDSPEANQQTVAPKQGDSSRLIYRVICSPDEVLPDCAQSVEDSFNSEPSADQSSSELPAKMIEPALKSERQALFSTDPIPVSTPQIVAKPVIEHKHKQAHIKHPQKAEKKLHHSAKHKK